MTTAQHTPSAGRPLRVLCTLLLIQVLAFAVVGCPGPAAVPDGSNGQNGSDGSDGADGADGSNGPDNSATPDVAPRLFVANTASPSVPSFGDPVGVNGNVAPDQTLSGDQTGLIRQKDVLVNGAGQLLVLSSDGVAFGEAWISVYDDALQLDGNQPPVRRVQGDATGLLEPEAMAIFVEEDLLFVTDPATDSILVFESTSQPSFDEDLEPIRTFTSPDINTPLAINFAPNGHLYLTNRDLNFSDTIVVFENAAAIDGEVDADRVIESAVFENADLFDVFIDENDTLYVLDDNGFIYKFMNASTLDETVEPNSTLEIPPAVFLRSIHVNSNGTAFIADENQQIFSYDNIAELDGAQDPDRTITGSNTGLVGPRRLFLAE